MKSITVPRESLETFAELLPLGCNRYYIAVPRESLETFAELLPLGCNRYYKDECGRTQMQWEPTAKSPLANLCAMALKTKSVKGLRLDFADVPETSDVAVQVIDARSPWPDYTFPMHRVEGIFHACMKLIDPLAMAQKIKADLITSFKCRHSTLYIIRREPREAWLVDGRKGVKVDYDLEWSWHEANANKNVSDGTFRCLAFPPVESTSPLHKDAKRWIGKAPYRILECKNSAGKSFFVALSDNRFHVLPDAWSPK